MNKLILKAPFFLKKNSLTYHCQNKLKKKKSSVNVFAVVSVITNLACQTHMKIAYDLIFLSKSDLTASCLTGAKFCFYRMSQRTQ